MGTLKRRTITRRDNLGRPIGQITGSETSLYGVSLVFYRWNSLWQCWEPETGRPLPGSGNTRAAAVISVGEELQRRAALAKVTAAELIAMRAQEEQARWKALRESLKESAEAPINIP